MPSGSPGGQNRFWLGCVKTQCCCYDSLVILGELMRRFVEEVDRRKWTLLPACLDDFIDEVNPVRVIDAFVDALDLAEMSFDVVEPAATGRPSYRPSVLLKLYIYGYLNRVQSSRRLEREAGHNVEGMWLLRRLAPDHKTIADFRKNNGLALRKECARFAELCREMSLLARAGVAIDGSKFKAVNNRNKNFAKAKVQRRHAQLEESVARYLSQLDTADRQEPTEALAAKVARLKEKLTKLSEEMGKLAVYEKQMLASPDQQVSLTDPDSRSMATSGRGSGVVNAQVAVDTEHDLIVAHEVTYSGSDQAQLANMAKQDPRVPRSRHYRNPAQANDVGRQIGLPLRQAGLCLFGGGRRLSLSSGERLPYHKRRRRQDAATLLDHSLSNLFAQIAMYDRPERRITRWEYEHLLDAAQQRLDANPEAMRQRREAVEHPFGTMKPRMGATHFLTKALPGVAAEMTLSVLAYNLTWVMNILGVKPLDRCDRGLKHTTLALDPGAEIPKAVLTRPRPISDATPIALRSPTAGSLPVSRATSTSGGRIIARNKTKVMMLDTEAFMRRLLLQVLPKGVPPHP